MGSWSATPQPGDPRSRGVGQKRRGTFLGGPRFGVLGFLVLFGAFWSFGVNFVFEVFGFF